MNDIKVCLATNWQPLWLHWKTLADQQSAWGSSLNGVLAVVQCMRQNTENSPGCSTAKFTNVGGRRQYTTHCRLDRNWPYRYRNWPYRYRNWPYRYRLQYAFQSPTHIECSSVFPSQETWTDTFSLNRAKFHQFFPLINFSCEDSFFLWSLFETSFSWSPQVWTQTLLHGYIRGTYFVSTRRPTTAWWTFPKTKEYSCNPQRGFLESRCETAQAYFRLPQSSLQTSAKRTMWATLGHFQTVRLRVNWGQTESE